MWYGGFRGKELHTNTQQTNVLTHAEYTFVTSMKRYNSFLMSQSLGSQVFYRAMLTESTARPTFQKAKLIGVWAGKHRPYLTLLAQLTTNNACTFPAENALYWVLNNSVGKAWVCQVWGDRTDTEIRQRDMYDHANALMQTKKNSKTFRRNRAQNSNPEQNSRRDIDQNHETQRRPPTKMGDTNSETTPISRYYNLRGCTKWHTLYYVGLCKLNQPRVMAITISMFVCMYVLYVQHHRAMILATVVKNQPRIVIR